MRNTSFAVAFVLVFASVLRAQLPPTKPLDFSRQIRPILADKCLACHSGEKPEGKLRLGEKESAFGGGDSGERAIVPGRPDESELVRRILATDDSQMPPKDAKPLTADEIERLKWWIAEGATWNVHWAFRPLANPAPPAVGDEKFVRNEIDRFVLAKLEEKKLTPSAEADRYTLIKRLYYDLLGLPVPVAEAESFANDSSADAYEKLVDRLLKSPHFGERWGRHWLDLAHFADSDGFEKDRARPDAHVYRDWVIEAFNNDLPFDQFTAEQLAGDLLAGATAKQRLATGFLRQTLTNEEGGVDQEEFRVSACFDRTETVGTVWLGLTVGCIRCHEHKYDPLPLSDYYRLFAFFNNAEELKSSLPITADNLPELERKLRPLEEALAARFAELSSQASEWETAEHRRIMAQREGPLKEHAVEIVSVESAARPETTFRIQGNMVFVEEPSPPANGTATVPAAVDKDTYTITLRAPQAELTGFKLHALPDDRLPSKGPGRAPNGNFVLTGFQAAVVSENAAEPLELHRAKADFAQTGFAADRVLINDATGKSGWAVSGKIGEAHWIQVRTRQPIKLSAGQLVRVVLPQQFGDRHLLGKFRLSILTGDERGLHLSNEAIAGALEMYPEKRVASTKQQLFDYFVNEVARDNGVRELREQIAALHREHKTKLQDVRTIGTPRAPRVTHVFHRGDFLTRKEAVEPGVPAILPVLRPRGKQSDRLDLARWLTSPDNFLTPRVAVNHVWQHLFGQGLVRTPNDFGTRGEQPTNPELLDWLAGRFQRDLKWSRRELIRTIVSSATYRQASRFRPECETVDPRNTLLFRQNRFRVESEIVRDLNLGVAGLLSPKVGGPSVFPPMPEDLAKLSYANNFSWKNSEGDDRYRRGMYTFFKRTIPHPNLMTFDSPDANVACVARTVSNTPLQALTLLNNEIHVEASQALAKRVLLEAGDDSVRLTQAWRLCVTRPPTERELSTLTGVLSTSRAYYRDHAEDAAAAIGRYVPSGVPAPEAAAWVATVRIVLNLDEFVTRE